MKRQTRFKLRVNKRKYKNAEYDDDIIEYLMKYLGLESYEQLQDFLKHSHIPIYQLDVLSNANIHEAIYMMISNFYYGER